MKSVDFTVNRLLGTTATSSDSHTRQQCHSRSPADDRSDHVTSDDVADIDDEGPSAGARNDDFEDAPRHEGRVEPLLIHPSLYLDYARQFLWQLTAAYRPGQSAHHLRQGG